MKIFNIFKHSEEKENSAPGNEKSLENLKENFLPETPPEEIEKISYYDEFGKPHLNDGKHITISHSHEFSVIVISDEVIGADLELLKEKTLKIAPRFMEIFHLENLSYEEKMRKATVIWGIKESVFKIKNEAKQLNKVKKIFLSQINITLDDYIFMIKRVL